MKGFNIYIKCQNCGRRCGLKMKEGDKVIWQYGPIHFLLWLLGFERYRDHIYVNEKLLNYCCPCGEKTEFYIYDRAPR